MKTILLTGATGFLGSHLLSYLANFNDIKIVALKRSFSNLGKIKTILSKPNCIFFDIDKIPINTIFQSNHIDAIVHCATEYGREDTPCSKVLECNLNLPIELLENALEYNVTAFINTDSYFNKKKYNYPHLLNYSLSKKALAFWLESFSSRIKIINVMLEHIYGEFDNPEKFVETMIRKIAIEKVPSVDLSESSQKRDFIYVGDVCKIYKNILDYVLCNPVTYENYEIGTGSSISIRNFVSLIKEVSVSQTILNFGSLPQRENEINNSYANMNKFIKDFHKNTNDIILYHKKHLHNIIQEYEKLN